MVSSVSLPEYSTIGEILTLNIEIEKEKNLIKHNQTILKNDNKKKHLKKLKKNHNTYTQSSGCGEIR